MTKENEAFLKINGFEKLEDSETFTIYVLKCNKLWLEFFYSKDENEFYISIDDTENGFIGIETDYKGDLSYFQDLVTTFQKYF